MGDIPDVPRNVMSLCPCHIEENSPFGPRKTNYRPDSGGANCNYHRHIRYFPWPDPFRPRIAFYDLLAMGMVGAVMGWPFGVLAVILAKASFWFLRITWIARLFSRKRGEGLYVFPYMVCIVAGAVLTKYFFSYLPEVDSFLYSLHLERMITFAWFRQ
jgi:hypothetical protein